MTTENTNRHCHLCKSTENQGSTFELGGKVYDDGEPHLICDICQKVLEKAGGITLKPGQKRNLGKIAQEVIEEEEEARKNLGVDFDFEE